MTDYAFEFESNDIFAIIKRGLVFRGQVVMGQASTGDRVMILGSEDSVSGTIAAIEKDGKLIEHTIPGEEIGILLCHLSNKKLDRLIKTSHSDETDYPPQDTYRQMLGISLPLRLRKGVNENNL